MGFFLGQFIIPQDDDVFCADLVGVLHLGLYRAAHQVALGCDDCNAHFQEVKARLDAAGIPYLVEPTIVRGLDLSAAGAVEPYSSTPNWWNSRYLPLPGFSYRKQVIS